MRIAEDRDLGKADVFIITGLYKERKWVQSVFDLAWTDVENEGTV